MVAALELNWRRTRLSLIERSQDVRIYYGTKTVVETVRQPEFECQATYRTLVVSQFRRHFWCHNKFWRREYVCLNSIESPPTQSQLATVNFRYCAYSNSPILQFETQEIVPERKAFENGHS